MTPSEEKARNMLKGRTTAQLLEDWEETERAPMPMTPELALVRGWIMDELEARDPEAFETWLEQNTASPREWFAARNVEDSTYTQDYDEFSDADPGL